MGGTMETIQRVSAFSVAVVALLITSGASAASVLDDPRCCVQPKRDAHGQIIRSSAVIAAFKKLYPCPSTLKTEGPCFGWSVNHTVPLICGGRDILVNLSWMPTILKAGPGSLPADRWEQKVYCADRRVLVPMPDPRVFRLEAVSR